MRVFRVEVRYCGDEDWGECLVAKMSEQESKRYHEINSVGTAEAEDKAIEYLSRRLKPFGLSDENIFRYFEPSENIVVGEVYFDDDEDDYKILEELK